MIDAMVDDDEPFLFPEVASVCSKLTSEDASARLAAVRYVRDEIIGNKAKKEAYARGDTIPRIVQMLSEENEETVVLALVVLNSFAWGSESSCIAIVKNNALPPLVSAMKHPTSLNIVSKSVQTFATLCRGSTAPSQYILQDPSVLRCLVSLLTSPNERLVQESAATLARCCYSKQHQDAIASAGALPILCEIVRTRSSSGHTCDACMTAVVEITQGNAELAASLPDMEVLHAHVMAALRDVRPRAQLLACRFLASLGRFSSLPSSSRDVKMITLRSLVVLISLGDDEIREGACEEMSRLVTNNDTLHKAAVDAGAVRLLAALVHKNDITATTRASALNCLAALSSLREDARAAVVDSNVLPCVIAGLNHQSTQVRLAACRCARSLSRSVKSLRTLLVDGGLALPLLRLLENYETAAEATGAVCNLVLDFSPVKKVVIDNHGVSILVRLLEQTSSNNNNNSNSNNGSNNGSNNNLIQSIQTPTLTPSSATTPAMNGDVANMSPEACSNLRLNVLWAIKNLVYEAHVQLKSQVMELVTFDLLYSLTQDSCGGVREQSLNIIRNLAHGRPDHVDMLMKGMGSERLVSIIVGALEGEGPLHTEQIKIQALYCAVNVATGEEEHKSALVVPAMIAGIIRCLNSSAALCVPALWVLINLTFDDSHALDRHPTVSTPHPEDSVSHQLHERAVVLNSWQVSAEIARLRMEMGRMRACDPEAMSLVTTLQAQMDRALLAHTADV